MIKIYTGINGTGKSNKLRELSEELLARGDNVICISNTICDKFNHGYRKNNFSYFGNRSFNGLTSKLMKSVIIDRFGKENLFQTSIFEFNYNLRDLNGMNGVFNALTYCRYNKNIGLIPILNLEICDKINYTNSFSEIINSLKHMDLLSESAEKRINRTLSKFPSSFEKSLNNIIFKLLDDKELNYNSLLMLKEHKLRDHYLYIGKTKTLLSNQPEFMITLIYLEKFLRDIKLIKSLKVFLFKDGQPVPIDDVSSGERALISNLIFIEKNLKNIKNSILIDEPENSLHPEWQRDYITHLLDVFSYYNIDYYIATHSPLITTGSSSQKVSSWNEETIESKIYKKSSLDSEFELVESNIKNIEESYLEHFDTITPENHNLSKRCIEILNDIYDKKTPLQLGISFLRELYDKSSTEKQRKLVQNMIDLANKHYDE